MAVTDFHAGRVGRNQRAGNAQVLAVAEQAVRIFRLEGQAEHGGYRRQGDVALVPAHAQTEDFFDVVLTLADDAFVGHGGGVGAGQR